MHSQGQNGVPGCHEDGVREGSVAGGEEAAGSEEEEDGVFDTRRLFLRNYGR